MTTRPSPGTRTETDTIECACCDGGGLVPVIYHDDAALNLEDAWEVCPLCNGTGREPVDVQARKHVEGKK